MNEFSIFAKAELASAVDSPDVGVEDSYHFESIKQDLYINPLKALDSALMARFLA